MNKKLTKAEFTNLVVCKSSGHKFFFAGYPVGSYVSYGRFAANGRRLSMYAGRVYGLPALSMPQYKFEEEALKLQTLKVKFANHLWRACKQSPEAWDAVIKLALPDPEVF